MHELYDLLHICGITLFFGGIIVSLAWLFFAEKRGQASALRLAVKRTHTTNISVIASGIALIIVSGLLQAPDAGGLFSQSWLVLGIMLFALSVCVWLVLFIPFHAKLLRIAAHSSGPLPSDFFTLLHRLYFFGTIIIILPLGTVALSIMKPHVW